MRRTVNVVLVKSKTGRANLVFESAKGVNRSPLKTAESIQEINVLTAWKTRDRANYIFRYDCVCTCTTKTKTKHEIELKVKHNDQ